MSVTVRDLSDVGRTQRLVADNRYNNSRKLCKAFNRQGIAPSFTRYRFSTAISLPSKSTDCLANESYRLT